MCLLEQGNHREQRVHSAGLATANRPQEPVQPCWRGSRNATELAIGEPVKQTRLVLSPGGWEMAKCVSACAMVLDAPESTSGIGDSLGPLRAQTLWAPLLQPQQEPERFSFSRLSGRRHPRRRLTVCHGQPVFS
jgi:hypothetical protein